jgi:hypothetical protein
MSHDNKDPDSHPEGINEVLCTSLKTMTAEVSRGACTPSSDLVKGMGEQMRDPGCSLSAAQAAAEFIVAAGRKPKGFSDSVDALLNVAGEARNPDIAALAVRSATILFRENTKHPEFPILAGRFEWIRALDPYKSQAEAQACHGFFNEAAAPRSPVLEALDRLKEFYDRSQAGISRNLSLSGPGRRGIA